MKRAVFALGTTVLALLLTTGGVLGKPRQSPEEPILLIVMDPLSKELACACVKGYGQRDYRKLASLLEKNTRQRVSVEFSDDLAESMTEVSSQREVIVVGDRSLVAAGAKKVGLKCHPICELTDSEGNTTAAGLFIARSDDKAKELKEISGRTVFLGLAEADEKYTASLAALSEAGLTIPSKPEKRSSYSEAALDLLDSELSPPPIGVIPGYALPLLEGCGSVRPGSLKVIGKTKPIPFITVFVAETIPAQRKDKILKALLSIKTDAKLLKAMESREGFRLIKEAGEPEASTGPCWPDWRGAGRDGHVPRLPTRLPAVTKFIWKKPAMDGGLAGLTLSGNRLILAERDFSEEHDVYRCLDAANGELLWRVEFAASGKLDYGQSPRATPVIHEGRAYLLGAFGGLRCVELGTGKVIWERDLPREFKARLPTWGMCSPPLIVDGLLVVNPGGATASLAALDCATGRTCWTTPGRPAAYSAFICGKFGGRRQIVGYDQKSLGGWDVKTGERLWQLVPPVAGDFNVPTPIAVHGGVVLCTENNGTRLYHFDDSGRIIPKPAAEFADLSPTTVSPVATCGRLFGAHLSLYCLDLQKGLKPVWHRAEEEVGDHATLIADDERVLVITLGGELILLDGKADSCTIISRLRLFENDVEVYSHPALVGTRLYARGGSRVICVDLAPD